MTKPFGNIYRYIFRLKCIFSFGCVHSQVFFKPHNTVIVWKKDFLSQFGRGKLSFVLQTKSVDVILKEFFFHVKY